jgi:trehalose synthase
VEVKGLKPKKMETYLPVVGEERVQRIKAKARPLRGTTLAHVNATAYGGGVAEILINLVPLLRDVGIRTRWFVIEGSDPFFVITKKMHNALQGNRDLSLSQEEIDLYLEKNKENAEKIPLKDKVVVIHDPQPAAMINYAPPRIGSSWIWRCHIDFSDPSPTFWQFLFPFVSLYDRYIFHSVAYAKEDLDPQRVIIMPPSIDPLAEKNHDLTPEEVDQIVQRFEVDRNRPIITQVARFDPWKGFFDVIDIYRLIKDSKPEVQLLLIANMAADDPEGWLYFDRTLRRVGEDPDVHVLTNLMGVHAREVNAFQRASDIVLQMSTREGFGLTVTEAMWKGKAVIGRAVGGIRLQINDGLNGFLVNTKEEAAEKALTLLENPELSHSMGLKAREFVLDNFVITSHIERYLEMIQGLIQ